jgi:hypothetical protein
MDRKVRIERLRHQVVRLQGRVTPDAPETESIMQILDLNIELIAERILGR